MADTLIAPLNDSFVDFDVLGSIDPETFSVTGTSHYADMVEEARSQRQALNQGATDWIVLRNRLSTLGSRNKRLVARCCGSFLSGSISAAPKVWPSGSFSASFTRAD